MLKNQVLKFEEEKKEIACWVIHAWVLAVKHPQSLRSKNFQCCNGISCCQIPIKT